MPRMKVCAAHAGNEAALSGLSGAVAAQTERARTVHTRCHNSWPQSSEHDARNSDLWDHVC